MGKKLIAVAVNFHKTFLWGTAIKFCTLLGLEKSVQDLHGESQPACLFWSSEEDVECSRPASFICPLG